MFLVWITIRTYRGFSKHFFFSVWITVPMSSAPLPIAAPNGSLQSARAVQWQRGSGMWAPYWLPAWSILGWLIGFRPYLRGGAKQNIIRKSKTHTLCVFCPLLRAINLLKQTLLNNYPLSLSHPLFPPRSHTFFMTSITCFECPHTLTNFNRPNRAALSSLSSEKLAPQLFFLHNKLFGWFSKTIKIWSNIDEL